MRQYSMEIYRRLGNREKKKKNSLQFQVLYVDVWHEGTIVQ